MTQNPYQVLGVPNGADLAECTQAYKRLAKKYHPDLNPGDRVAEAKMAEVNAAFDAIKNGNTADSTSTGQSPQCRHRQRLLYRRGELYQPRSICTGH